jgi:hypothetical protein
MFLRHSILAATALVLALPATQAMAADANTPATQSPIAIQISGGYATRETDMSFAPSVSLPTLFGEAALLYRLGDDWNIQADFAYHEHQYDDFTIDTWHVGGAIFQRNAQGLYGLAATAGTSSSDEPFANNYVIGPIGEIYQEHLTLGARANYVFTDYVGSTTIKTGDINLYGIFYPADSLALKLGGTYANAKMDSVPLDTYVANAEVEYNLVGNMSVFARAQYASQEGPGYKIEDQIGLIGARFYFGSDTGSLKAMHRSTTINNTVEWLENSNYGS